MVKRYSVGAAKIEIISHKEIDLNKKPAVTPASFICHWYALGKEERGSH
jgi:hypothetical protein